jgi:hypothetical protein
VQDAARSVDERADVDGVWTNYAAEPSDDLVVVLDVLLVVLEDESLDFVVVEESFVPADDDESLPAVADDVVDFLPESRESVL